MSLSIVGGAPPPRSPSPHVAHAAGDATLYPVIDVASRGMIRWQPSVARAAASAGAVGGATCPQCARLPVTPGPSPAHNVDSSPRRVGWLWVGLCWRQDGRWSGWWGRFGLFACTGALIVCGQPGHRVKGAPSGHELRPKTSRRALPEGRAYFVENLFGLRP